MKPILTFLLWILMINVHGQDFSMTFTSDDESADLDSITALNIRSGESVTLISNQTLILTSGTDVDWSGRSKCQTLSKPFHKSGQCSGILYVGAKNNAHPVKFRWTDNVSG